MNDIEKKHWSIATALEQIDACGFECEAGPLANAVAYQWLKAAAEIGPEFWPGQGVWTKLTAEVSGVKMAQWAHFYIVGCSMSSDAESRLWLYSLSNDLPDPSHYGSVAISGIGGDKLRLEKPTEMDAAA